VQTCSKFNIIVGPHGCSHRSLGGFVLAYDAM